MGLCWPPGLTFFEVVLTLRGPWVPMTPVALARHLHSKAPGAWLRLLGVPGHWWEVTYMSDRECATSPSCSETLRASHLVGRQVARLWVISGPRVSSPFLSVFRPGEPALAPRLRSPTFFWAVSGLRSLAQAFSSLPVSGLEPFLPSFLRVSSSADTGLLYLLVPTCPLKPLASSHVREAVCLSGSCSVQCLQLQLPEFRPLCSGP